MTTYTKTFEKNGLLSSKNAIEEICLLCKGINRLCNECPVNDALNSMIGLPITDNSKIERKLFDVISSFEEELSIKDIIFEKNPVMLAQNSVEDICSTCDDIGIMCHGCGIHEVKRTLASLPLFDIPEIKKKIAKKTSGGCGTSCGTKKKKK